MALKAVACVPQSLIPCHQNTSLHSFRRARYLRLPSALPKPTLVTPSVISAVSRTSLHSARSRSVRSPSHERSPDPYHTRRYLPTTEAPRPLIRRPVSQGEAAVSPIRSGPSRPLGAINTNRGRTTLWTELREAQKRSLPGTDRSSSVGSR